MKQSQLNTNKSMVALHEELSVGDTVDDTHESYVIVNEGTDIPPLGIDVDLPKEQQPNATKSTRIMLLTLQLANLSVAGNINMQTGRS